MGRKHRVLKGVLIWERHKEKQLLGSETRLIQIRNKANVFNSETDYQERGEFSVSKYLYVGILLLYMETKAIDRGSLIYF